MMGEEQESVGNLSFERVLGRILHGTINVQPAHLLVQTALRA
jgi:hypothetical protein